MPSQVLDPVYASPVPILPEPLPVGMIEIAAPPRPSIETAPSPPLATSLSVQHSPSGFLAGRGEMDILFRISVYVFLALLGLLLFRSPSPSRRNEDEQRLFAA